MSGKWVLVFSDGTGQRGVREDAENRNSNVYILYNAALSRFGDDGAFYDAGIGAPEMGEPTWLTWGLNLASKATGLGITKNITDCYDAILARQDSDMRVRLFGFSRGAYTARCVGGVLDLLGVACAAPRGNSASAVSHRAAIAAEAVSIYKIRADKDGEKRKAMAAAFRKKYECRDCWPEVVAVFDTVKALGIPVLTDIAGFVKLAFQNNVLSPKVKCGLQALSIDENRKLFKPELWEDKNETGLRHLEQVWFTGVHSDIGGGYGDDRSLANVTLSWMVERLGTVAGLDLGLDVPFSHVNLLGTLHDERTGFGKLWLKGLRTNSLAKRDRNYSPLCKDLEIRFDKRGDYRPEAAKGHLRLAKYY